MTDVMRTYMPEGKKDIPCYANELYFHWYYFTEIAFCSDGIYWQESTSSPAKYLSYDDLRNDPSMTTQQLQAIFEDFPDFNEVVGAIIKLRELE